MSFFILKDQSRIGLRKGICLRVRALPKPLLDKILSRLPDKGVYSGELRIGQIFSVTIKDVFPKEKLAILHVWSATYEDRVLSNTSVGGPDPVPMKYTVLSLCLPMDEEWICEGDQGRGLVRKGEKKDRRP